MLVWVQVPFSAPHTLLVGAISSVGRAPRLHRGCRRFEPVIAHQIVYAKLAQLVERVSEKHEVTGSSPVLGTTIQPAYGWLFSHLGRSHSGLVRGIGNSVRGNPSRVQISLSPPTAAAMETWSAVFQYKTPLLHLYCLCAKRLVGYNLFIQF